MPRYTFTSEDDGTTTEIVLDTLNECWNGYDGPLFVFFNFLKGCGFIFEGSSEIGVMDDKGVFRSASEY